MTKETKKKSSRSHDPQWQSGPWMSMRTGLVIIAITSIVMAVLTTVQAWPYQTPLEAIFWGLVYGGLVWAAFLGMVLINRFLGRR